MAQPLVKEELHRLIDSLPEGATLEDLRYALYVREQIEAGMRSRNEKPLISNDELRARYGLEPLD
ncbi:MAG: hypothetical protein AB7N24_12190 [Dehalococcoidia bacterium]